MKLFIRIVCVVFFVVFLTREAKSQQSWFELELSKKITKKLNISFSPEVRFKEDFDLNEYFLSAAAEYKFCSYFALGANYRFGNNLKKNGDSRWFGRYALDAKTAYKLHDLEAQFRIRYTNYNDFSEDEDKADLLRFKFKLGYAIKETGFKPYVAYEIYQDMDEKEINKARWEGGLAYKINKHHKIGAYFRVNHYLDDDQTVKIIGIAYSVKL